MAATVTLVVCGGPAAGQQAVVTHSHFVVGRSPDADLVIDDPRVSLADLVLHYDGERVSLENLDGLLFVNGERVEHAVLHDQDRIAAGQTEIQVRIALVPEPSPRAPMDFATVCLPDSAVPAAAVAPAHRPSSPEGGGRISLADIKLFHLGDSVYDPVPARPDFPDPPQAGVGLMRFTRGGDFTLTNPYRRLYGVVDAARNLQLAGKARRCGYDLVSLFLGAQAAQLADLAPYFFQVPHGAPFLTNDWQAALGQSCGVLIDSPATPAVVFGHLRYAFIIQDEAGQPYFFRYYDPRVLRPYLVSCDPKQLSEFFGPVRAWICEDEAGEGYQGFARNDAGQLVREELGLIEVVLQP